MTGKINLVFLRALFCTSCMWAFVPFSYSQVPPPEYDEWQWYEASSGFMVKEQRNSGAAIGRISLDDTGSIKFIIEHVDPNCDENNKSLYPSDLIKVNSVTIKMTQKCIIKNQFIITRTLHPATDAGMEYVLNEFKKKSKVNMTDSYGRSIYLFSANGFMNFYSQLKEAL